MLRGYYPPPPRGAGDYNPISVSRLNTIQMKLWYSSSKVYLHLCIEILLQFNIIEN